MLKPKRNIKESIPTKPEKFNEEEEIDVDLENEKEADEDDMEDVAEEAMTEADDEEAEEDEVPADDEDVEADDEPAEDEDEVADEDGEEGEEDEEELPDAQTAKDELDAAVEELLSKIDIFKSVADKSEIKNDVEVTEADENIDKLVDESSDISDDFKAEAKKIFQEAVKCAAKKATLKNTKKLAKTYDAALKENTRRIANTLVKKVDSFTNFVTEDWYKENRIAIETNLKNKLNESFIEKVRDLFKEHNVTLTDGEVKLIEKQGSEISELKTKLNENIKKSMRLRNENMELKKREIINNICEGMSTVSRDKFVSLAESVSFSDFTTYKAKLKTLKENLQRKSAPASVKVTPKELTEEVSYKSEAYNDDPYALSDAERALMVKQVSRKSIWQK